MTAYVVLGQDASGYWRKVAQREAASADAAIRAWAEVGKGSEYVAFVAVPARSWQPRAIKITTVTRFSLGDIAEERVEAGEAT